MKLSPKLKPYNKKLTYSYAFGSYPTIELFKYRQEELLKVVFHSQSEKSEAAAHVRELSIKNQIPFEVNDHAVEKIAFKENTYLIGIFEKYQSEINFNENHVVLVNPKDMGNIGTIIRTMVGLGVMNLALIRPAADLFDPKVIRSAMGSFFQMNFQYFESIEDYLASSTGLNLYPFMLDGATEIREVDFKTPFSLIFGTEGDGLPQRFKEIGSPVFIKQVGDIDSFNLATSAAIGLWESTRNLD